MSTPARPSQPAAVDQLVATLAKLAGAQSDLRDALGEQAAAMRKLDVKAMAQLGRRQESAHRRLLKLEVDRRRYSAAAAKPLGLPGDAPLAQIAMGYPQHAPDLMRLRDELRSHAAAAADLGRHCSRLAGGVLGHVNGALRLVTRSCLYGRGGEFAMPPVASRVHALG